MACRVAWFLAAFLVLCGFLVLFPAIDLWAAGLFYRQGDGFPLGDLLLPRAVRGAMPYLIIATVLAAIGLLLATALRRRTWHGLDAKAALFLLIALAVGPGLVVNTLFKDHWGRARPAQISQFGGDKRFTPAFVPSDQCARNCSFPAGDPATGFYFVSLGFLVTVPQRRRLAIGSAIALGTIIGAIRMAQGGHFLSDVVASFFLVFATSWLLHRWIVQKDGLAVLLRHLRHPPPSLRRFLLLGAVSAVAVAVSIAWLDRPLAFLFAASPGLRPVWRVITMFGVSTGYLVIAALLALGCAIAARCATDDARKRRLAQHARRAAFVFVVVGGAGLAGDILKPVFGRARPRLYLDEGIFGFTWHGARAAYWSFPSGHAITIVALALALTQIERRFVSLYVAAALLVIASRIVLDQHYLSDVIAGALLAYAACWVARAAFARVLSDSP